MTNGEKLDLVFPDGIAPFSKNWLDAEYKEPRKGHWIENAPQYDILNPQYICSECGNAHTRTTPYCEMCGAKMEAETINAIPLNDIVKLPKDEVAYGYICKQFPTTNIFFDSYETALNSAIHDQPKHRPFYMIKATRHFEFCEVVEPQESEEENGNN